MKKKLIVSTVKSLSLPAGKAELICWDTELTGFGVKLVPTGASYIVQARAGKGGRLVRHYIGRCAELSLDEARNKAMKALAAIRSGTDLNTAQVQQAKIEKAQGVTLKQAYADFLASRNLRPRTRHVYDENLKRTMSDWLDLPLVSIDKHMVLKRYRQLSNSNGPRSTSNGSASADQAMRLLRVIFNYAIATYDGADRQPLISSNPVHYLMQIDAWNKSKTRDHIVHEDDLADWYQATMTLENHVLRDALVFMLFSGLRRNECLQLKWKDIDKRSKVLTVPAEIAKTGKPRKLPLTDQLLKLYQQRHDNRIVGNDFIFPGKVPGKPLVEPRRAINAIIKHMNFLAEERRRKLKLPIEADATSKKFSSHDLRRSFATYASRIDISYYKLKHLLGHSVAGDVTGSNYVQVSVEDLRPEMQKITDWLKTKCGIEDDVLQVANEA